MSISTITIGANNYTSYASVAEADIRLAVDPVRMATWTALTTDQKGINLVAATNRLDLLAWQGEKTGGAAQANAWPRAGLMYPDGTDVADDEVPLDVEIATILLAGSIAIDAEVANSGASGTNTKKVQAGSASVEFFRPRDGLALQDESAHALIKYWLESSSAAIAGAGSIAYGDDAESEFCDSNPYGRTHGYG